MRSQVLTGRSEERRNDRKDTEMRKLIAIETVRGAGGYLLGRGTYEIFAAHWPTASEEEHEHDPLDEVRVMIDPLVVGGGKRFFGDGNPILALRLVESQVTGTGAIIAT